MNLLNYCDPYVPTAVKNLFKTDLGLTDAQTSWPLTAFVVVYMVASPMFGALADRVRRTLLIALGVGLWSLATAAAAWATSFATLLLARALVGVGEAAYAMLAPPPLSDLFPPERRNRILTLFYVAIPVGSALGFAIDGLLGAKYGWCAAFLTCGLPGLLAAFAALSIRDSECTRDPQVTSRDAGHATPQVSWPDALRQFARNPAYVYAVAGYTAVTFAAAGMADWLPTFLFRVHDMPLDETGHWVGTGTVIGGLGGTVFGGWLGDKLAVYTRNPYLALSVWTMSPAREGTPRALGLERPAAKSTHFAPSAPPAPALPSASKRLPAASPEHPDHQVQTVVARRVLLPCPTLPKPARPGRPRRRILRPAPHRPRRQMSPADQRDPAQVNRTDCTHCRRQQHTAHGGAHAYESTCQERRVAGARLRQKQQPWHVPTLLRRAIRGCRAP